MCGGSRRPPAQREMTENVNCSTIPRVRRLLLTVIALAASLALWSVLFGGVQLRFGGDDVAIARSGAAVDRRRRPVLRVRDFLPGRLSRGGGQARAPRLATRRVDRRDLRGRGRLGSRCDGRRTRPAGPTPRDTSARRYGWLYGPLPNPIAGECQRCRGHLPPTALAPLGYTAAPDGNGIVPTYAPGLPMMMAGLLRVAVRAVRTLWCPVCRPDGVVHVRARSANRRGGGRRDGDTVCRREPDRDVPGVVADDRRADRRAVDGCGGG